MLWSRRSLIQRLTEVLHLDEKPWRIALGLAAGVFISCTPFYGLHTLLSLVVAFILGVNKMATVAGAWINLPWFAPFVYGFSLKVGEFILSGELGFESLRGQGLRELAALIRPYLSLDRATEGFLASFQLLFVLSKPLFVGTTVVGAVAGLVTYFVSLAAIYNLHRVARLAEDRGPTGEE